MNVMKYQLSVIALCLLSGIASGQTSTPGKSQVEQENIECRDGSKIPTELWKISVPENRNVEDTAMITLAVLRVKSTRRNVGEPVFFIAGGPGGSSIRAVKGMLAGGGNRFFDLIGGDIVAIDQRGVGLSEPNLSTDVRYGNSPTEPGNPEVDFARRLEVLKKEAASFRERGIDLSGYNSEESADDIDAVRRTIGYEKIVLWGSSYGTHLAMATLRRHEEHIARALLIGPEGPDHTQKLPSDSQQVLEHISELATKQSDASQDSPDMLETLELIFERLDQTPAYADVDGIKVGVSKSDLQGLIAMQIISIRDGADQLPEEIVAMQNGDFSAAAEILHDFRQTNGPESMMALAMDAASGASSKRQRQIESEAETCLLGSGMNADLPAIAKAIGIKPLDDQFRSILLTDVPVQFIVGSLDYRTPVRNAKELMKTMPNAELVVVENCGHSDLPMGMPELRKIWGKFLSTGKGKSTTLDGPDIRLKSANPNADDASTVLTAKQMEQFEGTYRFDHGAVMKIKVGDGCLVVTIPGKGDFNFWPISEFEFEPEVSQLPVLTFNKSKSGKIDSATGNGIVAKRKGK